MSLRPRVRIRMSMSIRKCNLKSRWVSIKLGCPMVKLLIWSADCRDLRPHGVNWSCIDAPHAKRPSVGSTVGTPTANAVIRLRIQGSRTFARAWWSEPKRSIGGPIWHARRSSPQVSRMGSTYAIPLRHWHENEIYVKVNPPDRGKLDCCIMLFDSPADPRDYPWRTTWFAEHDERVNTRVLCNGFQQRTGWPRHRDGDLWRFDVPVPAHCDSRYFGTTAG